MRHSRRTNASRLPGGLFAVMLALSLAFWCVVETAKATSPITDAQASTVAVYDAREGIFGSGVIIAPGWVLTAAHVVEAADAFGLDEVLLTIDKTEYHFDVVAASRTDDLALLKVHGLLDAAIKWGSPGTLSAGDEVYVIGYPLGLTTMSVTKGIVSAPIQEVEGTRYVQTDASINPGNSGGPLVDSEGRLVGINVMKAARPDIDNMGFAVPLEAIELFLAGTPVGPVGLSGGTAASEGRTAGTAAGGTQPDSGGLMLLVLVIGSAGAVGFVLYTSGRPRVEPEATPRQSDSPSPSTFSSASIRLKLTSPQQSFVAEVDLPKVIGRDSSAGVRVDDEQVSRHHARLGMREDGRVVVTDIGSRNGIHFEGERRESFDLAVGQSFEIGRTRVLRER